MSDELNNESFSFAFHKAFGHANDSFAAYEQLRGMLIKFFLHRGHGTDAEYLTDDVIDRLLKKVRDDSVQFEDDTGVFRFALGVARNVNREQRRRKQHKQAELSQDLPDYRQVKSFYQQDDYSEALESCLKQLNATERKLLNEYYGTRRRETKRLALELGISHGSLRVKVLRLRKRLREMIDQYLNVRNRESIR